MRVIFNFSKSTTPLPIDKSCECLNSYIHRCLGEKNIYHDTFSPYSISSIQGGKLKDGALNFENGMYIVVSAPDKSKQFLTDLINGVLANPTFGYGMKFTNFAPQDSVTHRDFDYVQTISPILFKENRRKLTFEDESYFEKLTERTIKKLVKYDPNVKLANFKLSLVNEGRNKVKLVKVKDQLNKSSMMCLRVDGHKNTRQLLYDLGIGGSTGSGFGAVKVLHSNQTLN